LNGQYRKVGCVIRETTKVLIHPTAIVHPRAELAADVRIGPFCIVEEDTAIGPATNLAGHVVVKAGTRIGSGNAVSEFAVLGGLPQHVSPPGTAGRLTIGDANMIREHVTMHRSLYADKATSVGSGGMFMAGCHVAHDCVVGNRVILANDVLLAGHVQVGDRACFGGAAAIQQFCRIGQVAMVGGMARVTQDVPPFVLVDGGTTMVVGLNRVGLRRAGMSPEEIAELKEAYRIVYRRGLTAKNAASELMERFAAGAPRDLARFLKQGEHGFVQERRRPPGAVLRVFSTEAAADALRKAG
jgi:UDP-N-acetylglucosamine acyltransferase